MTDQVSTPLPATFDEFHRFDKSYVAFDASWRALIAHAEGRVSHANNGLCPDQVEGHQTRDPECPVCQALLSLDLPLEAK
nr:hypothetical protein [Stenotrophomonas maltophilia]